MTRKSHRCKIFFYRKISEGSEGYFHINADYDEEKENLTTDEKIELADFMINQWHHYKNLAKLDQLTK